MHRRNPGDAPAHTRAKIGASGNHARMCGAEAQRKRQQFGLRKRRRAQKERSGDLCGLGGEALQESRRRGRAIGKDGCRIAAGLGRDCVEKGLRQIVELRDLGLAGTRQCGKGGDSGAKQPFGARRAVTFCNLAEIF